jgi:flagellar biosynthetic protein FliR
MGIERVLDIPAVLGFMLTLARISGVFVFVPLPGLKSTVDPARILLALGVAISLYPVWPRPAAGMQAGLFTVWLAAEAALGLGIGLAVSFAVEAFMVGAQAIGLQAGFSFASTIDPFSQADSATLVVFAQTIAAALFFALGLDREIVRVFARSMETAPPGSFTLSRHAVEAILAAGSTIFSTGLRLALPVIAVMIMVDISLALLGRVNAQLHLVTIAFPVKIIVGLGLLAWIAVLLPALIRAGTESGFSSLAPLVGH